MYRVFNEAGNDPAVVFVVRYAIPWATLLSALLPNTLLLALSADLRAQVLSRRMPKLVGAFRDRTTAVQPTHTPHVQLLGSR